jgi:hypothetical protein
MTQIADNIFIDSDDKSVSPFGMVGGGAMGVRRQMELTRTVLWLLSAGIP